jgi:hypothetical protein
VKRAQRGPQDWGDRADGKRGRDHYAGKSWTVLGSGLGRVGARVEEVGAGM